VRRQSISTGQGAATRRCRSHCLHLSALFVYDPTMTNKSQTPQTPSSDNKKAVKSKLSQGDIPMYKLAEALRIPEALRDNYGLKAATPLDVGIAIGIQPTSGKFRSLTGSAIAYGLTTGGYNAAEIGLTDLGRRAVAPTVEGDADTAKREAFEKPKVIREFIDRYDGQRLPDKQIVRNVLQQMGVPFDQTDRAYEMLTTGMADLGYIKEAGGARFVQRPKRGSAMPIEAATVAEPEMAVEINGAAPDVVTAPPQPANARPNAIFLGHGKNTRPLEQLVTILDEYGIQHKEAVAEPNAGRPIPVKVAETMRECGAAVLIFTADERYRDANGNELLRPSDNVVYELGAASMLYDNRIIIFKEEGVELASNFVSIGHITFEKDKLSEKGIELFRELVKFKVISVSVGG
jgi:predicted nucleotide-binding protein